MKKAAFTFIVAIRVMPTQVTVIQKDTALLPDGAYTVSFAAEGEAGKKIHIKIAGQSHISELSGS